MAATNPVRKHGQIYNRSESLVVNSGLPAALLSRFDLVVLFTDKGRGENPARVERLTRHVLESGPETIDFTKKQWTEFQIRNFVAWCRERPLEKPMAPNAAKIYLGRPNQKVNSKHLDLETLGS